jgi:ketosteroid isomerase-like protein
MSQENVEVVRGIWEADRRRDVAAVRAAYAPDVEWEDNTVLWGDLGHRTRPGWHLGAGRSRCAVRRG